MLPEAQVVQAYVWQADINSSVLSGGAIGAQTVSELSPHSWAGSNGPPNETYKRPENFLSRREQVSRESCILIATAEGVEHGQEYRYLLRWNWAT